MTMNKVIAVLNVVAWAGFWAFGYLALTADAGNSAQMTIAMVLAALGGGVGVFCYMWLVRHCERTGYARKSGMLDPETREAAQAAHGAGLEG